MLVPEDIAAFDDEPTQPGVGPSQLCISIFPQLVGEQLAAPAPCYLCGRWCQTFFQRSSIDVMRCCLYCGKDLGAHVSDEALRAGMGLVQRR